MSHHALRWGILGTANIARKNWQAIRHAENGILTRLAAKGRGIAIALHDLSLAARFCSDAVILTGGRVLAAGETRDVLTAERLTAAFGVAMAVGTLADVPVVVPKG